VTAVVDCYWYKMMSLASRASKINATMEGSWTTTGSCGNNVSMTPITSPVQVLGAGSTRIPAGGPRGVLSGSLWNQHDVHCPPELPGQHHRFILYIQLILLYE